jgi:hypothetical protein
MPVRKIPKRSGRLSGRYPSIKLKRMVAFESMIERDLICLLDYAPAVTYFEEQPLTIVYEVDGKTRRYTPDFCVAEGDCRYLIECKSAAYVDDQVNQPKFAAAQCWCAENGYEFLVVSDETLKASGLMPNIRVLTHYGRFDLDERLRLHLTGFLLTASGSATLSYLTQALPEWPERETRAATLYLVYHQAIALCQPLSSLILARDDLHFTSVSDEKPLIIKGVSQNGFTSFSYG